MNLRLFGGYFLFLYLLFLCMLISPALFTKGQERRDWIVGAFTWPLIVYGSFGAWVVYLLREAFRRKPRA